MTTTTERAFQFSLQYCAAAKANGDGTYGTAQQFPSAKTLTLALTFIHDKAEGNSIITALASQIIEVKWGIDGANLDQALLAVTMGETQSSSNSGANEVDTMAFSNDLMPYFGIVAQAWGQHGDDYCFLIPYTKTMDDVSWKLDFGKFPVPAFKGEGIKEPSLGYMLHWKWHATKLSNPVFPPSWA